MRSSIEFDVFVHIWIVLFKFVQFRQSRISSFSQWRNTTSISTFHLGGSFLWEKTLQKLIVSVLNVVPHGLRASGSFLWELPAMASRTKVVVELTWMILWGTDPSLVSKLGLKCLDGRIMTCHDTKWENNYVFVVSLVKTKHVCLKKKHVCFRTEEKIRFLERNGKFVGSWCARYIFIVV